MGSSGRIVICGAGVIGAAIAQALARRGAPSTIVDRVGIAPGASGKAAGFLALDWNDGTPLGLLARRSFELHRELAQSLDADYGYRSVETLMAVGSDPLDDESVRVADNPDWLDGNVAVHRTIGTPDTTAQVHPRRFTEALIADAEANGASLSVGVIEKIDPGDADGTNRAVEIDGERIEADLIVVAMGPWTARVGLPIPQVGTIKGCSITLGASVPAQVVFSEYVTKDHSRFSPEIYPRDGEVYVCGVPSAAPLPTSPDQVEPDGQDCERLRALAAGHSSTLRDAPVTATQACFRSTIADGLPAIGPVPGIDGLYVATGHGPWGILNAPATGEMVAEMILDGAASTLDAAPFSPARR